MSCSICCDDYTDVVRKPIECPECKNSICLSCFKRYLLDNRTFKCIFPDCQRVLTFIEITNLTQNIKFSNEIMDKIALINLEEEKNYLPQRQGDAKRVLEERKYEKRRQERCTLINELNGKAHDLDVFLINEIRNNTELLSLQEQIDELQGQKRRLNFKLFNEKREKLQPYHDRVKEIREEDEQDREYTGIVNQKRENHYTFVKQCSGDNCKGFLENNPTDKGWKCTLCEKLTCRRCQQPLEKGHKCDEGIIENLKEIKKDTKPCPKCGTGIFKVDGCDVMFCISCQTYFSWNSGKIFKRALHNPDAVRWMREQGRSITSRALDEQECLDPLTNNAEYYAWMYQMARRHIDDEKIFNTIIEITNQGVHIEQVVLSRFRDNYGEKARDLAIKYLLEDDFDENKWSRGIRKIKKEQMLNKEISNIIGLFIEVTRTVLNNIRQLVFDNQGNESILGQLTLLPQIAEECNQKFEMVKTSFNSKRKIKFVVYTGKRTIFSITI